MTFPAAIVIGCSAGGLDALKLLLSGLHANLPQPVIVCTHTGSDTIELLCELLSMVSTLPVIEAGERQPVRDGVVQLAPSGYHLLVEHDRHFSLSVDARVNHSRPSIDVLFASAAEVWRESLIGVILTGANTDGADGLRRIRGLGGTAIVQRPHDAESPQMPRAALERAGADHCVELAAIAALINRLCTP